MTLASQDTDSWRLTILYVSLDCL